MSIEQQLQNISFMHFAILNAFALAVLFVLKSKNIRLSLLWALANVMAALSMINPSVFVETKSASDYNLFGFIMAGSSLLLPYFSLAGGQGKVFHFHKSFPIFGIAVVMLLTSAFLPYGWLPSVIGYSSGGVIVLATAWVCFKNRYWRGLWGQSILISSLCACAVIMLWHGWLLFEGREGAGFRIDPEMSLLGLWLIVVTGGFIQVGFMGMVGERELRSRRFAGRRATRLFEISKEMVREEKRLAAIANERLFTLDLLTHDVRQPINNAHAALEALDAEIKPDSPKATDFKKAIGRAQAVLDAINLSISNAILVLPLLEKENPVATRYMNAYDLVSLAKFDCPVDLQDRIKLGSGGTDIFADIDPILVRIAVRNLLDNALKYAPALSEIQLDIIQREDRLGTSITVTNKLNGPNVLNENIFMKGVRGSGTKAEGSGLGLFLVRKVAEAHFGTISYAVHDQNMVTFDLFFPD
jgi:signal transduction histidine kinase